MADELTDFGFERVPPQEKTRRVREIFGSVASRYDLMNDLMSAGSHRVWKRYAICRLHPRPGQQILDLAGGTGDLTALMAPAVGPTGRVVLSDLSEAMLARGRDRLFNAGIAGNVAFAQVNAERLPFADESFDAITIAFGLRNVTRKEEALESMYRVLKPGGQLMVLEFSRVVMPFLERIYDLYSFQVLPRLGRLVAGDEGSYRYLVESIRRHPDQDTLAAMMTDAGFEGCHYHNLSGGITALHRGYKY
jgi:demethylmenaquinone methyltransferase/2-methoxy-6-polyprenyl-1,4-benzoquinol methylase